MIPKIYLPKILYFGNDPSVRFYNLLTYASNVDAELIYDAEKLRDKNDAHGYGGYDVNRIYCENYRLKLSCVVYPKPKYMLTIIDCELRFSEMLFEFPQNIHFIDCRIFLNMSNIVSPPVNCIFDNCYIYRANRDPGSPKLSNKIVMATRALLKNDKRKL